MINELYALSLQERDYPSQVFLQWYISEQVEEEKIASQIVEELKMAGDNPSALLVLNGQLAARRKAAS
jgi:ferritin